MQKLIWFGLRYAEVDMVWIAVCAADDRDHAIEVIKANIDDSEMELITLSVDSKDGFTRFEDLDEGDQELIGGGNFYLYNPYSVSE